MNGSYLLDFLIIALLGFNIYLFRKDARRWRK